MRVDFRDDDGLEGVGVSFFASLKAGFVFFSFVLDEEFFQRLVRCWLEGEGGLVLVDGEFVFVEDVGFAESSEDVKDRGVDEEIAECEDEEEDCEADDERSFPSGWLVLFWDVFEDFFLGEVHFLGCILNIYIGVGCSSLDGYC